MTDVPGTTRDAIEADTSIDGFPFRLVDTAGVRTDPEEVERLGIEVARRYFDHADVLLLCVEGQRPLDDREAALATETTELAGRVIVLRTKADLTDASARGGSAESVSPYPEVRVSVVTGQGIGKLKEMLAEISFGGLRESGEPALVTRARHTRALERADTCVAEFQSALDAGLPAEIAETHLADTTLALEEIIGATDVEDLLGAIFESFCVGK